MVVEFLVYLFYTYLIVGFLFGLWFVFKGVKRVDQGMTDAKWILRLMILPGTVALWPLMLRKSLKSKS